MREILFRGKHDKRFTNKDEWIYGVPYIDHEGDCLIVTKNYRLVVTAKTVGQYTGLTDKNGTKIFEGDVLAGNLDNDYPENRTVVRVVWHKTGWHTVQADCNPDPLELSDSVVFEVIGNVHDNPELLEGE